MQDTYQPIFHLHPGAADIVFRTQGLLNSALTQLPKNMISLIFLFGTGGSFQTLLTADAICTLETQPDALSTHGTCCSTCSTLTQTHAVLSHSEARNAFWMQLLCQNYSLREKTGRITAQIYLSNCFWRICSSFSEISWMSLWQKCVFKKVQTVILNKRLKADKRNVQYMQSGESWGPGLKTTAMIDKAEKSWLSNVCLKVLICRISIKST